MQQRSRNLSARITFMLKSVVLCMLVISTCSPDLFAQNRKSFNRFNAGFIFGLTTSQIDGDHIQGYDKFGVYAGVRAIANITKKDELIIEMQFTQKGSRDPERIVPGQDKPRFISLNYIEVPILFHHKFDSEQVKVGLEFGLAFSKLLDSTVNENAGSINYDALSDLQDDFNDSDLSLVFGAGIYLSENLRLAVRSTYSLTLLFESKNPVFNEPGEVQKINKLRNIQLSAGVNYNF